MRIQARWFTESAGWETKRYCAVKKHAPAVECRHGVNGRRHVTSPLPDGSIGKTPERLVLFAYGSGNTQIGCEHALARRAVWPPDERQPDKI